PCWRLRAVPARGALGLPCLPTRRSSDLGGSSWSCDGRVEPMPSAVIVEPPGPERCLDPLGPLDPQWASTRWGRSSRQGRLSLHGDRKSTRLNSSHVSTSYAVLCLTRQHR